MVGAYQREFHSQVIGSSWLMAGATEEYHVQVTGGSPRSMSVTCVKAQMWLVLSAHFLWRRYEADKFIKLVTSTV